MSEKPEIPPDPIVLRSFIMYEVLLKNSVDKAYNNLRKAAGDDVIDREEFEFWYYRFYNGDMDVSYDRSAHPKPRTFDDFPVEILAEIVSKLDAIDSVKVRRVCRKLSDVSRQMSKKLKFVRINVGTERIFLTFDKKDVMYHRLADGCSISRPVEKSFEEDYLTKAMQTLSTVLDGSKIEIKTFDVYTDTAAGTEEVLRTLQNICAESKFKVTKAVIQTESSETTQSIVELLKPKALESVKLVCRDRANAINIRRLQDMQQFQNAKRIYLQMFGIIDADLIFNHFRHFEMFRVFVHSIDAEQIYRLRTMLSAIGSAHFKRCIIRFKVNLKPAFGTIRRALGEHGLFDGHRQNCIRYHHGIPNTRGAYLEFVVHGDYIKVTRHQAVGRERLRDDSTSSSSS